MTEDTFASRLKALLTDKQLKLKQVADVIGISGPAVHKWTRGGEIDYDNLRKLADFLEVNWVWLRYGDAALQDLEKTLGTSSAMAEIRRKYLTTILENEARMKLAQEVSGIVTWEWNVLSDVINHSANSARLFGREVLTMEDFRAALHPEDVNTLNAAINQSLAAGGPYEWEFRVVWPNQEIHWIVSRATLVPDPDNRPTKMVGISLDITERKRAEDQLRKSESMLARAQEIAHVGSWDWYVPEDDLMCSDEWYRIFGLLPQAFKITYDLYLAMLHPDDRARIDQVVQEALRDTGKYCVDYRIVWPDGNIRIIHEEADGILDAQGRVVRMTGTSQDITAHQMAAQSLSQSEERYRSIFEQSAVGIAHLSLAGYWLRVNQKLCEMLGYGEAELLGQTLQQMTHENDMAVDAGALASLQAGEITTCSFEKCFKRKDGSAVWTKVTVSYSRNISSQAPEYLIAVIEDLAEKKQVQLAPGNRPQRPPRPAARRQRQK